MMINLLKLKVVSIVILWVTTGCSNGSIGKDKNLNGLSEAEVISELGNPNSKGILLLHKESSLLEYQSDLYKVVSDSDTVKIKEMYWEGNSDNKVLWLERKKDNWIVFDNLKWSKDIDF